MGWKKVANPRKNVVTIKYSDEELAAIKRLMKAEGISKQAAARRLSFGEASNETGL